jgi:hypothetical protein
MMADNTKLLLLGAAGAAVWWFYIRKPAAPSTSTATAVPDPNAITGANTVAGIQARVLLAAKAPADGLPVDEWGFFLNESLAPLGKSAPDPMPLFVAAVPGFDRGQKLTAGQYWAVMGPALKSQLGLSGLGMYGGC